MWTIYCFRKDRSIYFEKEKRLNWKRSKLGCFGFIFSYIYAYKYIYKLYICFIFMFSGAPSRLVLQSGWLKALFFLFSRRFSSCFLIGISLCVWALETWRTPRSQSHMKVSSGPIGCFRWSEDVWFLWIFHELPVGFSPSSWCFVFSTGVQKNLASKAVHGLVQKPVPTVLRGSEAANLTRTQSGDADLLHFWSRFVSLGR